MDLNQEKELFERTPVPRAILRLALPSVVGQIILVVYNMADTFFVAQTGSDAMISAVTVCMPAFMFLSAIANLFGVGGSSVIAQALGKEERDRAGHASAFALAGCAARVVLYGDMAALLVHLDREERLYPLLEELERLSRLSQSYLGLRLTAGVGFACRGPEELNRSAAGARSALDYRVLAGGVRVIYIGDLEPQPAAAPSFEEEDQRALSAAVKLGTQEQAEDVVRGLMDRLRRASLSQCDLFLLEVVTCLVRLTRSGGLPVEEVFGEGFTGAVSVSEFSSLEELGSWLGERCGRLHDLLGRRRSDSAWQMVERAKDYIAGHYTDEQLSVEALCSHIHLSPTYFSTLFKREVGMTFTAYVTEVRMEQAARLLRDTDEKTYLIAGQTGYADPNYFSYVFKRHFGVSPSKFRAGGKTPS